MVMREQPIGGAGPSGPLSAADAQPLPQAKERPVSPDLFGERPAQPDLGSPAPMPTVAVPSDTPRLVEILGSGAQEGDDEETAGLGPRLVVLHHFVRGATRGNVVWASDLLGRDVLEAALADEDSAERNSARKRVKAELKRLVDLGAVREANGQEARYENVVFVESVEQAEAALQTEQDRSSALADENERLRRLLAETQARTQGVEDTGLFATNEEMAARSQERPPAPVAARPAAPRPVAPVAPTTAQTAPGETEL